MPDPTPWRLIAAPQPLSGPMNMAVDEAIFDRMAAGNTMPTLRLYAWNPYCLSLGCLQPAAEADAAALARLGWDLVRRPTGGRAILHAEELTYSVAGLTQDPRLAGSVLACYRRLAQALVLALVNLGLEAAVREDGPTAAERRSPVCFEVSSNYEITIGGKKILGSAQARRGNRVLQHGSLPLRGDLTRVTRGLAFETETARQTAAERLLQHAVTVEMIAGSPVTWEQAALAFIAGFENALDLRLAPGKLTAEESALAEKLYREKYAGAEWTWSI